MRHSFFGSNNFLLFSCGFGNGRNQPKKNVKTYDDGVSPWLGGDKSGKTITAHFYFNFKSGSYVDLACYDWSDEITKEKNFTDHLAVGLFNQKFGDWLVNEAYK